MNTGDKGGFWQQTADKLNWKNKHDEINLYGFDGIKWT
jgi:hypothetical protein